MFGADFVLMPFLETKLELLHNLLKNKEMKFIFYFLLGSFFLLTVRGLISVRHLSFPFVEKKFLRYQLFPWHVQ